MKQIIDKMRTKENIIQFSQKCQECFKQWEKEYGDITNEFIINNEITLCLDPTDDKEVIEEDNKRHAQRISTSLLYKPKEIKYSDRSYGLLFE